MFFYEVFLVMVALSGSYTHLSFEGGLILGSASEAEVEVCTSSSHKFAQCLHLSPYTLNHL